MSSGRCFGCGCFAWDMVSGQTYCDDCLDAMDEDA